MNSYERWHQHPYHHHVHWITFIAVCLLVGMFLTKQINVAYIYDLASTTEIQAAGSPATQPLLQSNNLTYVGSFRLPAWQGGTKHFDYAGSALAFNPAKGSLMAVTLAQEVAEFGVPTLVASSTIGGLAQAAIVQPYTDVLAGHRNDAGTVLIGGLLPLSDRLIVSTAVYYDNSFPSTSVSHFRTGVNFAALGPVTGPVQIGPNNTAGFVGGWMAPIPTEWQVPLGGTALTGQCCLAIVSRTSYGPSATVFDPLQVGAVSPVPATRVLAYPSAHANLGTWETGVLFNGATQVGGMVFPGGTSSVLFFGRLGARNCYGEGTSNSALDGTLTSDGVTKYCYDEADHGKGPHGYPYKPYVWAYNVNDFVAVKNGTKNTWDIQPYATWEIHTPFETNRSSIVGAAYDPGTQRIFISSAYEDGNTPLIHVFTLGTANLSPAPTITFSSSPTSLISGASSTLTWSSTNATSCTASNGWSGTKATSGTLSVSPIITTTYVMTCTGAGGSAFQSATVTVTAASTPAPTLTLSSSPSSVISGSSSTLTWSSTDATSCTASNGWSGTKATSGTLSVSPTATSTYTLSCTGNGGSVSQSSTVTITSAPATTPISGDLNQDGIVNSLDWSIMNSKWLTANTISDLNHDGIVNSIDFSILNRNWFKRNP